MDPERLICERARKIDASGIRRVFELGRQLKDPINLSIGQPDFPVPDRLKAAAVRAIDEDRNGYTVTQGIEPLRERVAAWLRADLGWDVRLPPDETDLVMCSGTSGAIWLLFMSVIGPGDEAIIPDPYFVMYPHVATACGGKAVVCDTYPDFRMTAARVEPLITARTKLVLLNSPGNPSGVVLSTAECQDLLDLCRSRDVLLVSDEIYDEFTYSESRTDRMASDPSRMRCPSPGRLSGAEESMVVVRGFGKTYGVTGWRLGYAAGAKAIIQQMTKIQQYTFVCAPAPLQWACVEALDVDMSAHVEAYEKRRDMVVRRLGEVTDVATPGGAFYAFPRVPDRLGLTASQFIERALQRNVLTIPGSVFSKRDTHLRLSYATDPAKLARGLDILVDLMRG